MNEINFTKLETVIDKVIVYLDGARIYRSGKTELKKGFQVVKVQGLTKNLIKDSVRVTGKGKGTLGGINIDIVYQKEASLEELNSLLQEEEKLKKELQTLNKKLDFTNMQNERMKVLSDAFSREFPQWLAAGETQLTTLSTFIDFESKRNAEFLAQSQKLMDNIQKLNDELKILQAKINQSRNLSQVEQTFEIAISVDVEQAGPFVFEFNYQAKGVNWAPSYDIDLKTSEAVLKGMAQIVNRTLENWADVSLEISTAVFKPLRVIEPNPFYIDIYTPRVYAAAPSERAMMAKPASPAKKAKAVGIEKEEAYEEPILETMAKPTVELKESPSGVQSFDISGKWTIPSDGNEHPVTLTTHELKTEKEFYWSSIAGLGVIAQDKITNTDAIILAGNAKVYSDGEFIGETYVSQVAPGEEFKLGAREEMKIKAEKKLLKRLTEKAGVIKGKRSIFYEYELNIKSFRKDDSKLVIKDVIPYSKSEIIKVKDFASSIEPTNATLGIYTWEITIKPTEELKINYKFLVEWEKDYTITPPLP